MAGWVGGRVGGWAGGWTGSAVRKRSPPFRHNTLSLSMLRVIALQVENLSVRFSHTCFHLKYFRLAENKSFVVAVTVTRPA